MKTVVFLAFVALSQAIPWYGYQLKEFRPEWDTSKIGLARSAYPRLLLTPYRPLAEDSARNIIGDVEKQREGRIEEGIEELGREQLLADSRRLFNTGRAIGELRRDWERDELSKSGEIRRASQLKDTLEAAIEGQIVADRVEGFEGRRTKTSGQDEAVFQARLQKLIDRSTVSELQGEISKQRRIIRQLEIQEQFLDEQKQLLEAERAIVRERGDAASTIELRRAEERIRDEERRLAGEKYARSLAITLLTRNLYGQEDRIIKDSIFENVQEEKLDDRRNYRRDLDDEKRGLLGYYPWTRRILF